MLQTDRVTDRHTDRQTELQTGRGDKQTDGDTHRQLRQGNRYADRQTDRDTHRQEYKQSDRQTGGFQLFLTIYVKKLRVGSGSELIILIRPKPDSQHSNAIF